jgi:hypothetical protein
VKSTPRPKRMPLLGILQEAPELEIVPETADQVTVEL